MTPDLDSMPGAQLSFSSGKLFTADPAKVFSTVATTATTAGAGVASAAETAAAAAVSAPEPAEASTATASSKPGNGEGEGHGVSNAHEASPDRAKSTSFAAAPASDPPLEPPLPNPNGLSLSDSPPESADAATRTVFRAAAPAATAAAPAALTADTAIGKNPGTHPLVLSGRRVWVISPVVGWASVWAETGQNILTPAGTGDREEEAAAGDKSARGTAAQAEVGSWPGLKQPDVDWLNPLLPSAGKVGKGGTGTKTVGLEEEKGKTWGGPKPGEKAGEPPPPARPPP